MDGTLQGIVVALRGVSKAIIEGWSDKRTLREAFGYHHPALTRLDLAEMADVLADKIEQTNILEIDSDLLNSIQHAASQLDMLKGETISHFYNGNGWQAVPAYVVTLQWLQDALSPVLEWQSVADTKLMPPNLARRVRSIQARLDAISPETDAIEEKIRLINGAAEAADSLPTDLDDLKKARAQVEAISTNVAATGGKVEQRQQEVEKLFDAMKKNSDEAQRLVDQCGEAYRITTTVGLAAAFERRASTLGISMWVWVFFLLVALAIGAYIGAQRVELLTSSLQDATPNWGVVWIHVVLSVISVGAPLWFAWLATKQIGQRFRLAEDYGFKASVAKAYEGYRREAARLDEDFESRLFSSALTRLEEPPLRLVEETSHGSPWHELVNSESFREALDKVPSLRSSFGQISSRVPGRMRSKPDEVVGEDPEK